MKQILIKLIGGSILLSIMIGVIMVGISFFGNPIFIPCPIALSTNNLIFSNIQELDTNSRFAVVVWSVEKRNKNGYVIDRHTEMALGYPKKIIDKCIRLRKIEQYGNIKYPDGRVVKHVGVSSYNWWIIL